MSVSYPVMGLGLPIFNNTFSIPSTVAGVPAGWTNDTRLTSGGQFSDGPTNGHYRWQRYVLAGTNTYASFLSAPCDPGFMVKTGSTKMSLVVWYRVSGVTGSGQEVNFYLQGYNTSDVSQDRLLLRQIWTPQANWTLGTWEYTHSMAANVSHRRLEIVVGRASSGTANIILDLAFVGIMVWNGSTSSYYTFTQKPDHPGNEMVPSSKLARSYDDNGLERHQSRDGYRQPFVGRMSLSGFPDDMCQNIRRAWMFNKGRIQESVSTDCPEGGRWPILLMPGQPSWPAAVQCNFDGDNFPFRVGTRWYSDPPRWTGEIAVTEELGRV